MTRLTTTEAHTAIPSKVAAGTDLFHLNRSTGAGGAPNRLIYGGNFLATAAKAVA